MRREDLDQIEGAVAEGLRGLDARLAAELHRLERDTRDALAAARERIVVLEQRPGAGADVDRLREQLVEVRDDLRALRVEVSGIARQVWVWAGGIAALAAGIPLAMRLIGV